jgi:hypothetical protein
MLLQRKPVLAFYDVPDNVRTAIVSLVKDKSLSGGDFEIRVLDSSIPLTEQLKKGRKPDLVITWQGEAARSLSAQAVPVPEDIKKLMPGSIQTAGADGNSVFAVPLLLDSFELAYSKALFGSESKARPTSLQAIEAAARGAKGKSRYPIICAGADDEDLFLLLGALTEAMGGEAAWDQVANAMRSAQALPDLVKKTPLGATVKQLSSWREEGLLHPQWIDMTGADLAAMMANQQPAVVLMTLSRHRTLSPRILDTYESIPFPSGIKAGSRSFTVPVIEGILIGKRPNAKAKAFIYALAEDEGQRKLTEQTGLAPVNSRVEAQDQQASDVRLWAAASDRLLPELYRASYASTTKRKQLADDIRSYLKTNGTGI